MLKKLLISLLAVGAAAAPYGTTEFMDLVADDDDTFYCIIGGDCSHWVDVIRREVGLTMDELITLATDVSVFKLNEPDENLRWDTASPTASDFERADAPASDRAPPRAGRANTEGRGAAGRVGRGQWHRNRVGPGIVHAIFPAGPDVHRDWSAKYIK